MPIVRKLTPEEVDALAHKGESMRKKAAAFYDDLLRDCVDGDEVELELEADERRLTAIARLKAAAARRSPALQIVVRRTRDPLLLRFRVLPLSQVHATVFDQDEQELLDQDEEQPHFNHKAFSSSPIRYQSGNGRPARSYGFARFSQRKQRASDYGRAKQRRRW